MLFIKLTIFPNRFYSMCRRPSRGCRGLWGLWSIQTKSTGT